MPEFTTLEAFSPAIQDLVMVMENKFHWLRYEYEYGDHVPTLITHRHR